MKYPIHSRRFVFRVVCLFAFAVLFATQSLAQSPTQSPLQSNATLRGTITDPSGAALPGALVEARQTSGAAVAAETHSSSDGAFSLAVPPGQYRVTVSAADFSPLTNALSLAAGDVHTFDARLQLATMSSNVIVTAQALAQHMLDVVAPVDVLTRQDIDRQGHIWLTPLLTTVPGISVSQLGPMGGITSLFLDGGNSNYSRILVDGVPADVSLSGISIDLSNYSTDAIDKIEVVHGASSALYGSDAMTGVIQIFSHRGTTTTPRITLEGEGGSFATGRGGGEASGKLGAFDYAVGAGYFSSAGPAASQVANQVAGQTLSQYFRDTTLSGNFGWTFSATNTLRLTLRNSTSDAGQPGQTLLASPQVPFAVSAGEHNGEHDFASGLAWDVAPSDRWQNHLQIYDSRFFDRLDIPQFPPAFVNKFNRAGFDDRATYLFRKGSATAGYAFETENGAAQGRHDHAGYIEVRYKLIRRLTAIVGGRVEANNTYGTRFVPRVDAAYALREGAGRWGTTKVRASFGQGIKEPPLFPQGCTPILKPEQSTTFDVGFDQYAASDRVKFSVTYFHNDFRNIVSFQSGGPIQKQNCGAFFGSFFNTDKARAFGTNSSIQVRATRWIDVGGTYSYDDSKVLISPNAFDPALKAGNRLLKRPLNAGNLFFNAHYRGVNWNVTGYFVGRRTDSDFLGIGITRNPGYARWDTSAIVPLRYGLSFTAHVQNLFDNHYQDAIGYPALGYSYRLGLRFTWGPER